MRKNQQSGDRAVELTQREQQKEKRMPKSEDSFLWDDFKQNNICITESRRKRKRKKGRKLI